jgi:hypothetical protein
MKRLSKDIRDSALLNNSISETKKELSRLREEIYHKNINNKDKFENKLITIENTLEKHIWKEEILNSSYFSRNNQKAVYPQPMPVPVYYPMPQMPPRDYYENYSGYP